MKAIPVPFCAPYACPYALEVIKENKTFRWCRITNKKARRAMMDEEMDSFPEYCPLDDLEGEGNG